MLLPMIGSIALDELVLRTDPELRKRKKMKHFDCYCKNFIVHQNFAFPEGTESFVVYYDASHNRLGTIKVQKGKIHEAQVEAFEKENSKDENLHGIDKEFETLLDGTLCIRSMSNRGHQKDYTNARHKPLEFQVGDMVMLKVSPWKGVIHFGKRGKLNPHYIGPFKFLAKVGTVAYQLELPE
ncbi:hypothetical protein Tco_1490424 [Tanacetum coccineum]